MFAALHIMWSITVFTNDTVTSLTLQKSRECTPIEVGLRALADMTWRAERSRYAAICNARSPTVDSRVRRTGSDDVDADRRQDVFSEVRGLKEFIYHVRPCLSAAASQNGEWRLIE